MKRYKYHSQRQAEEFAGQILPVPKAYPLKEGLPENFRDSFERLCTLAGNVYLDMAKEPEAYGVMLLDVNETDHNLARNSYRTIHRFVDALNALFLNGELANHSLCVDAARFRTAIRKLPSVPKYGLILSKLRDFGFTLTHFNGTSIDKKVDSFTVEYPEDPEIVDALKAYCECWKELDGFRRKDSARKGSEIRNALVKLSPQEFHHHFYRFDYKITADLTQIPVLTWVNDEADYQGFDETLKAFQERFYLESLKYKGLQYDGDFHYKGKRIARITQTGYSALGEPNFLLSLKLKNVDRYMDFVKTLPENMKEPMKKDSCSYCGFQGSTKEYCKFRLNWTLDDTKHTGCSFWCFNFNEFGLESVPLYYKLLELEYGIKEEVV